MRASSGLLFALAGLLLGIGMLCWGTTTIVRATQSESWSSTQGTVLFAEVEKQTRYRRNSKGVRTTRTVYVPRIRYRYTVDGQEYTGSTIGHDTSEVRDAIETGQYVPGAPITVYYNPEDPSEAVLAPGLAGSAFAPCLLGVFFTFVSGGLAIREGWKRRRQTN